MSHAVMPQNNRMPTYDSSSELPMAGINMPRMLTRIRATRPPIMIPEKRLRSTFVKRPIIAQLKNTTAVNRKEIAIVEAS